MITKVLNTTHLLKVVAIVTAEGNKDSINIQPSGRVELPEGTSVPDSYRRAHPEIKIVEVS